jgi:DDE superfamily endonuclease/Winged helix-turn helix
MADHLWDEYGTEISISTISRRLKALDWTTKKVTRVARQRSEYLRAEWNLRLESWTADQLVFLDESAANERTADRKYGWAPKGIKSTVSTPWVRSERWSILPALTSEGYIACHISQGSITASIFNDFVAREVLPQCGDYRLKEPHSILVVDNASIHRSKVSFFCYNIFTNLCLGATVNVRC